MMREGNKKFHIRVEGKRDIAVGGADYSHGSIKNASVFAVRSRKREQKVPINIYKGALPPRRFAPPPLKGLRPLRIPISVIKMTSVLRTSGILIT